MKKLTLLAVALLVASNAMNAGWGDKAQAKTKEGVNKTQETTKKHRNKVDKEVKKASRRSSRASKKPADVVPMP